MGAWNCYRFPRIQGGVSERLQALYAGGPCLRGLTEQYACVHTRHSSPPVFACERDQFAEPRIDGPACLASPMF